MDVLFTIPTVISPNVDEKLIPALCKMIERNILINYRPIFVKATQMAYLGPGRGLSDSFDPVKELSRLTKLIETGIDIREDVLKPGQYRKEPPTQYTFTFDVNDYDKRYIKEAKDDDDDDKPPRKPPRKPGRRNTWGKEPDKEKSARSRGVGRVDIPRDETQREDSIESPKGITFYRTVNLEPTFLDFSIEGRAKATSSADEVVVRHFRIGMKSVPYKLDGITDLKKALTKSRNRSLAATWYSRTVHRMFGNWVKKYRKFRGKKVSWEADLFNMSMTYNETKDVKILSRLISGGESYAWAPLVIFSKNDFDDKEYKENMNEYKRLVSGGWGNMIVIDDYSESVSFCLQREKACYSLSYSYLRQILNLDDVIDAGLYGATSSGFGQIGAGRTPITPSVQQRGAKISTNDIMSGNF